MMMPAGDLEIFLTVNLIEGDETILGKLCEPSANILDLNPVVIREYKIVDLTILEGVAPSIVHKTEVGGVRVNLGDAAEVRRAFERIVLGARTAQPDAVISGVLVQAMVQDGRELIVGMTRDPVFGPLVMFGLGGILVEVLRDVSFRIAPFGRAEARRMMGEIRGARLLDAVRGSPPADRTAVEDVLLRIAQLVTDFPEIAELDVNPLMAMPSGAIAADARVMLAPPR